MVITDPEFSADAVVALRQVYPILLPDDVILETPTFRAGSAWHKPDQFLPPTTTRNYLLLSHKYTAGGELGPRTSLHLNLSHTLWTFDLLELALQFHRENADTNAGNDKLEDLTALTTSPATKLISQSLPSNIRVGEEPKLYVGLSTSAEDIPRRQRASVWSLVYLFVCENTLHRLHLTKVGTGAAVAKPPPPPQHKSIAALNYLNAEDGIIDLGLMKRLAKVLEDRTIEMVEMGLVHGPRRFSDALKDYVPSMHTWANEWERYVTKSAPKPANPALLSAKAQMIIDNLKSDKPEIMIAALHWEVIDPVMRQFVRRGGIEVVVGLLLSHSLNSKRPKGLQPVLGTHGGICMQAAIILGLAFREPGRVKYYPGRAVLAKLVTMFCCGDLGETMAALHVLADLCAGPPPLETSDKYAASTPPKKDLAVMTDLAQSVWILAGMAILCRMGDLYRTFGDLGSLQDDHGFHAAMADLLASFAPALISWEPEPSSTESFACHVDQTYVLGHCVSGSLDAAYHLFQLWTTARDDDGRSSKIPPLVDICARISLICEGLPSVAEQLRGYRRWQDIRRLVTAAVSPELAAVHGWNELWRAFTDLCTRAGGLPKGGVEEARRLRGIGPSKSHAVKEASLVDVDSPTLPSKSSNSISAISLNQNASAHVPSTKKKTLCRKVPPRTSSTMYNAKEIELLQSSSALAHPSVKPANSANFSSVEVTTTLVS